MPASAPLRVKFANLCAANCDDNFVFRKETCDKTEMGQSAKGKKQRVYVESACVFFFLESITVRLGVQNPM